MKKPIWFLAGPFHQYNEDVKALAAAAGVRIIDANVTDSREGAAPDHQVPAVTLRDAAPAHCETLLGSSTLPTHIDLGHGSDPVQLGTVVAAAHAASGLTAAAWNKLASKKRDALLAAQVELLTAGALAASLTPNT